MICSKESCSNSELRIIRVPIFNMRLHAYFTANPNVQMQDIIINLIPNPPVIGEFVEVQMNGILC